MVLTMTNACNEHVAGATCGGCEAGYSMNGFPTDEEGSACGFDDVGVFVNNGC